MTAVPVNIRVRITLQMCLWLLFLPEDTTSMDQNREGEHYYYYGKIDHAVLGRQLVARDGKEFFEWCKSSLEVHDCLSKRKFFMLVQLKFVKQTKS